MWGPNIGYSIPTDNQVRLNDKDYQAAMASGQYQGQYPTDPVTGKPLTPAFQGILNSDGTLQSQYQLGNGGYDSSGLDAMKAEALRTGPSQWAQMQQASQANQLAKNQAGQLAGGLSSMASQGGLGSGSRERLIQNSMKQGLMNRQDLNSSIANQDEQKRMQMLSQLPQAQLAAAQFNQNTQKANIGTALNDITQKRAFDTNNYNQQMQAWGAAKTAAATPSSSKK